MHNVFLNNLFENWRPREPSRKIKLTNKILKKLGKSVHLSLPSFSGYMTNIEQRMNLFHLVEQVLAYQVPGELAELGCHKGETAALIQTVNSSFPSMRRLHVYDSFEGLPGVTSEDGDTPYQKGQLSATKDALIANFERFGLQLPVIHEGFFEETLPHELPEKIAFAHLDGDLFESILVSLKYVYPRLSQGAVCVIDDYCDPSIQDGWNLLPGVKAACDEFLHDKPEEVSVLYAGDFSHGYFRKS